MKSVGPFKTAKQIELYLWVNHGIQAHVYHVHSQRKLKIVYAKILSKALGGLSVKTINVNAIYYVSNEDIDNIAIEIEKERFSS